MPVKDDYYIAPRELGSLYSPLDERQLRLLRLWPAHDIRHTIEGELCTCELANAPPYEALSYVWGSSEQWTTIVLGNVRHQIPVNLSRALSRLRQNGRPRVLWVDALCIDQCNIAERSSQVALMGEIYAKAKNVVVYVGEATAATDVAMDYMMQIEQKEYSHAPPKFIPSETTGEEESLKIKEGFRDILSRPLFEKVWILQDFFNAQAAVVQCGSRVISSKTFVYACKLWLDKSEGQLGPVLDLLPGAREDGQPAPKYRLYELLRRFQHTKATDARDKVFALLGLLQDRHMRTTIVPDYSMSLKDLMRTIIAALCFCEVGCVPEPRYETIDEFLSDLDAIDSDILEQIFESSQEIDLASLLRHGSHYIRLERSLIEAAGRNKTKGDEMVELLREAIDHNRSASPTPSETTSVFSDVSAPSTHTSYPPEDVEISVWHLVEILLTQDTFANLCTKGFQREDLEPLRFTRNLRRLLKTFGGALLSESQSYSVRLTSELILRGSRRMAALIQSRYDSNHDSAGSKLSNFNSQSMTESEKRARIEHLLYSAEVDHVGQQSDAIENSGSEDEAETDLHEEAASVSSLDEIEAFVLSSKAFDDLVESLASFLKLPKITDAPSPPAVPEHFEARFMDQGSSQSNVNEPLLMPQNSSGESRFTPDPDVGLPAESVGSAIYNRLSRILTRIERPRAGLHRIQYTCVSNVHN